MEKQGKPLYKKWWLWVIAALIVIVLIISLSHGLGNGTAESKKVGNYQIYKVKVTSIKRDSYHNWLVRGTTSAPNGAKIMVTPYDETSLMYGELSSESPTLASWEKVNNGKFAVLADPVGLTNAVNPSAGSRTKVSIFAITNYHKPWTEPSVSKRIVRAANSFGYTHLTVDSNMANYIKSLGSKKKSHSDSSDSTSSSSSTSNDSTASSSSSVNYRTDITYDQLARTPDNFKNTSLTLTGEVIQVTEGKHETDLRVAIDGNYDDIVYIAYDPSIMNKSRVLENDKIQFYGTSEGTTTYTSTMGGKITIPLVIADKINDQGQAPDDYGN